MTTSLPATTYRDHFALAELPYFAVRDGRLVIADPDIGPAVDVHTHLALAYVRRHRVDLWREHERTRHYLSLHRSVDLDLYMNKNFAPDDLKEMKVDLSLRSLTGNGLRVTHTVPNLAREMKEMGISHSVLLPIDFPLLSHNAEVYLDVASKRRDMISLGSVHPFARKLGDKLEAQKRAGARGVKIHPAVQQIAPNHPRAMKLYRLCADLDLPVLFHCGPVGIEPKRARKLSQLALYAPAVTENPDTVFVLGHSGALQMEQALELAVGRRNVYLDLSCQSLTNVKKILDCAPSDRIMLGSDWPFYHQAPVMAKVLLASEGRRQLRRRVLFGNAARLFRIPAAPGCDRDSEAQG